MSVCRRASWLSLVPTLNTAEALLGVMVTVLTKCLMLAQLAVAASFGAFVA